MQSSDWQESGPASTAVHRAQQSGEVRPEITTPDIIILLKGLLRSINDAPPGTESQALADRLLTVVTDGLRPHP